MCSSPLRALASPKILSSFKPKRTESSKFAASNQGSLPPQARRSSGADFKIKKQVGADHTRQQALNNSRCSSDMDSELADSDAELSRSDSIARLVEDSKMRRLNDAKRVWRNQGEQSPFRHDFEKRCSSMSKNGSSQGAASPNLG
jgi:hypothetical protein